MSTERFKEFLQELRPFAGLWQSAEFTVIAVGDKSGDLVSLVTSVVLKPDRVGTIRVLRDVRPPGLTRPFLAASVEYPLLKALNEWEPIRTLIEYGRYTLEVGDNVFPVRLFGGPVGPDADQSGSSWTKVLDQSRTEAKTRFAIDRRCIALLNVYDSTHALCRLVTDDLLKEIDSKLRARPYLIDGLGGLMSELMPGMRLTMDACPPVRVVAPLPFDLKFQAEGELVLDAPEAAFAGGIEVSVFFRPAGDPYSFQLGVANSVEIGPSDMREWRQYVSWPSEAQTARAVLLYQTRQIEELRFGCLPDSTAPVAHSGETPFVPLGRQPPLSPQPLVGNIPLVHGNPRVTRRSESVEDWQATTPTDLVPAIEHIRTTFDESVWKCSEITKKLCFAALHPDDKDIDLQPYEAAFISYRTIIGPRAAQQFDNDRGPGTPPAIFHAFLQALAAGIRTEVGRLFNDVLQIGIAHKEDLKQHPADWAKSHLAMLINGNKHIVRLWIQSVCDKQDYTRPTRTDQEFEDFIHWRDWRAPKLIYMRPSGNLPYDPSAAWTREDEQVTEKLLASLSARVVQSLGFDLDTAAGRAHVELAKMSRNAGSALEGDDRRFAQMAIEKALMSVSEDDRPHPKVGAVADDIPTAFISYSWDGPEHKDWVLRLAERLRAQGGVRVILDRWNLGPGEDRTHFMEESIRTSDFVLIVCTPAYATKANNRAGGVGYEAMIITSQLAQRIQQNKFIPVLRSGKWDDSSVPIWLQSKIGVDLRSDPYKEDEYGLLLRALHRAHLKPPPVGPKPVFSERGASFSRDLLGNAVSAVLESVSNKVDPPLGSAGRDNEDRPKLSPVAYAFYETKGADARRVQAFVRPTDATGQSFRFETSTGERLEGTDTQVAQQYLAFDLDLRKKGYSRMQTFDGFGGPIFRLPS